MAEKNGYSIVVQRPSPFLIGNTIHSVLNDSSTLFDVIFMQKNPGKQNPKGSPITVPFRVPNQDIFQNLA